MGKIDRRAHVPFPNVFENGCRELRKGLSEWKQGFVGLPFLNTKYHEFSVNSRKIIRQFAFYNVGTQ